MDLMDLLILFICVLECADLAWSPFLKDFFLKFGLSLA